MVIFCLYTTSFYCSSWKIKELTKHVFHLLFVLRSLLRWVVIIYHFYRHKEQTTCKYTYLIRLVHKKSTKNIDRFIIILLRHPNTLLSLILISLFQHSLLVLWVCFSIALERFLNWIPNSMLLHYKSYAITHQYQCFCGVISMLCAKRRNEHCKQKDMKALRFLSLFCPNSIAFNLQHVDY